MLKKHSVLDNRGTAGRKRTRTARPDLANLNLRPAVISVVARADRPNSGFGSVVTFFMEGFVLYGASLHPAAAFDIESLLSQEEPARQREPSSSQPRGSVSLVPPSANSLVAEQEHGTTIRQVEFGRSPAIDVDRSGRWNWLTLSWKAIAVRWMKWREESQIKRAVAALAEFDDRTLRDMGIVHRSQIEQVVRYCRDC
jgi:uncharacterized protein YjiS (DUF1127 family)